MNFNKIRNKAVFFNLVFVCKLPYTKFAVHTDLSIKILDFVFSKFLLHRKQAKKNSLIFRLVIRHNAKRFADMSKLFAVLVCNIYSRSSWSGISARTSVRIHDYFLFHKEDSLNPSMRKRSDGYFLNVFFSMCPRISIISPGLGAYALSSSLFQKNRIASTVSPPSLDRKSTRLNS